MTHINGNTRGMSEDPMQLPGLAVVLSAHLIKIDIEITIREQKQNLWTSKPMLSLCHAKKPSDLT